MPTNNQGPSSKVKSGDVMFDAWDQSARDAGRWFRDAFDMDVKGYVRDRLEENALPTTYGTYDEELRAKKNKDRGYRGNPYSLETADAARGGHLSAIDKLMNGTSSVGAQASQAMSRLGSATSGAAAGGNGLSQAAAARAGAAGASEMAGEAGSQGLAEYMGQLENAARGYGRLAGQDQSVTNAHRGAGVDARRQDNAFMDFYADQYNDIRGREKDLQYKNRATVDQMEFDKARKNEQTAKQAVETFATIMKMFMG